MFCATAVQHERVNGNSNTRSSRSSGRAKRSSSTQDSTSSQMLAVADSTTTPRTFPYLTPSRPLPRSGHWITHFPPSFSHLSPFDLIDSSCPRLLLSTGKLPPVISETNVRTSVVGAECASISGSLLSGPAVAAGGRNSGTSHPDCTSVSRIFRFSESGKSVEAVPVSH